MMKIILILITAAILTSCGNPETYKKIIVERDGYKSEYIGDINGTAIIHAYKVTVDSVEYIVVGNGQAIAIIKHSK